MAEFFPRIIAPFGPTNFDPIPQAQDTNKFRRLFRVVVPVSRIVRLDEIQGSGAAFPGTIYQFDYFLLHPMDGGIEKVWFASTEEAAQTKFTAQLVDEDGDELTPVKAFEVLPREATVLVDQVGTTAGAAVLLRLNAESQTAILYVTVELKLNETP
jgi:hypothetical protein